MKDATMIDCEYDTSERTYHENYNYDYNFDDADDDSHARNDDETASYCTTLTTTMNNDNGNNNHTPAGDHATSSLYQQQQHQLSSPFALGIGQGRPVSQALRIMNHATRILWKAATGGGLSVGVLAKLFERSVSGSKSNRMSSNHHYSAAFAADSEHERETTTTQKAAADAKDIDDDDNAMEYTEDDETQDETVPKSQHIWNSTNTNSTTNGKRKSKSAFLASLLRTLPSLGANSRSSKGEEETDTNCNTDYNRNSYGCCYHRDETNTNNDRPSKRVKLLY